MAVGRERVRLIQGDCLEILPTLAANSVDSIVCDPPYGLSFMGKDWDYGVPGVPFWEAALRVAKPGAMLLAFGGTRTFHRLTVAIEDAGWEIRDCLTWLYGSGFPKSLDIGKAIDKAAGAEREVIGRTQSIQFTEQGRDVNYTVHSQNSGYGTMKSFGHGTPITAPATDAARQWDGWGTALKPAWEPIILAMKPLDGTFANNALTHGVAGLNVDACRIGTDDDLSGGTYGGVFSASRNADGSLCKAIGSGDKGRWPANLLLDEEAAKLLDEMSGECRSSGHVNRSDSKGGIPGFASGKGYAIPGVNTYNDPPSGASRFFYVAKSSRRDRNEGLEGMPLYKMRDDLTSEQREYVTAELQRLGVA